MRRTRNLEEDAENFRQASAVSCFWNKGRESEEGRESERDRERETERERDRVRERERVRVRERE